jgi:hypothetical protein
MDIKPINLAVAPTRGHVILHTPTATDDLEIDAATTGFLIVNTLQDPRSGSPLKIPNTENQIVHAVADFNALVVLRPGAQQGPAYNTSFPLAKPLHEDIFTQYNDMLSKHGVNDGTTGVFAAAALASLAPLSTVKSAPVAAPELAPAPVPAPAPTPEQPKTWSKPKSTPPGWLIRTKSPAEAARWKQVEPPPERKGDSTKSDTAAETTATKPAQAASPQTNETGETGAVETPPAVKRVRGPVPSWMKLRNPEQTNNAPGAPAQTPAGEITASATTPAAAPETPDAPAEQRKRGPKPGSKKQRPQKQAAPAPVAETPAPAPAPNTQEPLPATAETTASQTSASETPAAEKRKRGPKAGSKKQRTQEAAGAAPAPVTETPAPEPVAPAPTAAPEPETPAATEPEPVNIPASMTLSQMYNEGHIEFVTTTFLERHYPTAGDLKRAYNDNSGFYKTIFGLGKGKTSDKIGKDLQQVVPFIA